MAKKKVILKYNIAERRDMVSLESGLSVQEQCEMVSIHRSGFYYVSQGESEFNLEVMRLIDAYFLEHPIAEY